MAAFPRTPSVRASRVRLHPVLLSFVAAVAVGGTGCAHLLGGPTRTADQDCVAYEMNVKQDNMGGGQFGSPVVMSVHRPGDDDDMTGSYVRCPAERSADPEIAKLASDYLSQNSAYKPGTQPVAIATARVDVLRDNVLPSKMTVYTLYFAGCDFWQGGGPLGSSCTAPVAQK